MGSSPYLPFTICDVTCESRAGVTLTLDGALPVEPGQFLMVWLPHVDERPFAVMDDDPLRLTIAEIGPFTSALCAQTVGGRVWLRGPFGRGFRQPDGPLLLVGGGSGSASLSLLAKRARSRGTEVTAVVGARSADRLLLPWCFEALGCRTLVATDDGSAGYAGTVIGALDTLGPLDRDTMVCGCGPEPMLLALARWATASGLACQVSLERKMKCGFGLCGACHAGDRLVCHDGPVFAAADLLRIYLQD
jgi:dihydroorotate dehydrogenase electron transfer subunit